MYDGISLGYLKSARIFVVAIHLFIASVIR